MAQPTKQRRRPPGPASDAKRPYESPLRRAQTQQTRKRIVDAAYRLLQRVSIHDLSYAELAEQLAISPRTIYRHFPKKDELALAVVAKQIERLSGPTRTLPTSLPEVAAMLRRMHALLEKEPGTYRLFFHLPIRSQEGAPWVERVWRPLLSKLAEPERRAAAGIFELFMGPYAYDVLHCNWGLSATETSRVCLAALDLVASALERDRRILSPRRTRVARFQSGGASD